MNPTDPFTISGLQNPTIDSKIVRKGRSRRRIHFDEVDNKLQQVITCKRFCMGQLFFLEVSLIQFFPLPFLF